MSTPPHTPAGNAPAPTLVRPDWQAHVPPAAADRALVTIGASLPLLVLLRGA